MTEKTSALAKIEGAIDRAAEPLTMDLVRKYHCPLATDVELYVFVQQCILMDLNPFRKGEVFLIKYSAAYPATTVVGFPVYLARAEKMGRLNGWEVTTEGSPKTPDFKAILVIHRKDWAHPFRHEVYWEEVAQYKTGSGGAKVLTSFWDKSPRYMIKKTCMGQGFRLCFPAELAGLPYTVEEMPVGGEPLPVIDVQVEKGTAADIRTEPKQLNPENTPAAAPAPKPEPPAPAPAEDPNKIKVDYTPKPKAETPKVKAAEVKTEAKPEVKAVGDVPIWVMTINKALSRLETKFGRDSKEIVNDPKKGILARVKKGFGTNPRWIEDLNQKEGEWILTVLDATLKAAEDKAAEEAAFEASQGQLGFTEDKAPL